jgi:hypothetical protein
MFLWYLASFVVLTILHTSSSSLIAKGESESAVNMDKLFILIILLTMIAFQLHIFATGLYSIFGPGY